MTSAQIATLKGRFKAGRVLTQEDYETLIDAFASASNETPIPRAVVGTNVTIGSSTFGSTGSPIYDPILIEDIVSDLNVDMTNSDYLIVVNNGFCNGASTNNKMYVSCGSAVDNTVGITVIDDKNAVMFTKYTDNYGNTVYTPVDRGITITPYELSQLAQESSGGYGESSGGS